MQIHLFISGDAPAANRLKIALMGALHNYVSIRCHALDDFEKVISKTYQEFTIAVVMVAKRKELVLLRAIQNDWKRFKAILILPDEEQEMLTLRLDTPYVRCL